MDMLTFLPDKGVCGTVYLYLQPDRLFGILTWDGKKYNKQGETRRTLSEIHIFADATLMWANGWPRVECCAVKMEINPVVRVEIEHKDGQIQRLTAGAAEKWMQDVNGVLAASALRYGQTQVGEHPWEYFKKE